MFVWVWCGVYCGLCAVCTYLMWYFRWQERSECVWRALHPCIRVDSVTYIYHGPTLIVKYVAGDVAVLLKINVRMTPPDSYVVIDDLISMINANTRFDCTWHIDHGRHRMVDAVVTTKSP